MVPRTTLSNTYLDISVINNVEDKCSMISIRKYSDKDVYIS